ncbi:carboxypeptidase-like regulatory domain-containing protein [Steroidobacter agaridevorans]|uniref:carboxypeptidase-like regulatory domain-containing protein n=1 Tax=Steroidobacter agaridevorans TaxID=2695856 RepID=UPI00132B76E3|nr:carboxypeptidase-like regulatory domain-containing protein [Steroidobacter agaridevorans]GFE91610.1 hypothetical protein GCM10011488_65640 [Steroidobacter agaridevorans]
MASFRSGRSLGKAVLSTLFLSVLAACGGGGGGGGGDGGGTPPPPAPTGSRLTLTGTVTDAPIPSAVVTATIGGQTFTATADANGNYRLELTVAQSATGEFITLKAKGAGPQSYVEFTSLLGTFQALKTQAGSDEILSSSENFATQITNVSTALAVLLQQANGGQPVASQTSIDTLTPTLNAQQLLDLAAAIKLLVDQPDDYPMPSGQTSLQALLANTTARKQLVSDFFEQDPATFQAAQSAIANDPTLTRPVTSATLPSTLTAVLVTDDDAATYAGLDRAISYTFNTDGTGKVSSGTWQRNMTWSISGASVDIVYETPVTWLYTWERKICPTYLMNGYANYGYADYPIDYDVAGARLTLLNERVLAITETRQIRDRACSPVPATEVVTVARTLQKTEDFQTIDAAELRDSIRTLWIYDLPIDHDYASRGIMPDLARLQADGTGTTEAWGKRFTWSLDGSGRILSLAFEDGVTAKLHSLRELNDFATEMLFEFTLPSGERFIEAGASVRTDLRPQLGFTLDNTIGRHYRFGVDNPPLNPGAKGSRWRFDADGFGSQERERIDENGNLVTVDGSNLRPQWGYNWRLNGNDLVEQHTEDNGTLNCDLRTNPFCNLDWELRIVPLAREGSRTYVLEWSRDAQPDAYGQFTFFTAVVYYNFEPFGATAVVNGKPSSAGPVASAMRRDSHIARGAYHKLRN